MIGRISKTLKTKTKIYISWDFWDYWDYLK